MVFETTKESVPEVRETFKKIIQAPEKMFEMFATDMKAAIQRCQIHLARNVLCKVPRKMKQRVADRIRDIFYDPSR